MRNKPNRIRNKEIIIWLNDYEYDDLKRKVAESGLSQQAFIIRAIRGTVSEANNNSLLNENVKTPREL